MFIVLLPNGQPLLGTKSDTRQSAMAKAMMMDVPGGCRVIEIMEGSTEMMGGSNDQKSS